MCIEAIEEDFPSAQNFFDVEIKSKEDFSHVDLDTLNDKYVCWKWVKWGFFSSWSTYNEWEVCREAFVLLEKALKEMPPLSDEEFKVRLEKILIANLEKNAVTFRKLLRGLVCP